MTFLFACSTSNVIRPDKVQTAKIPINSTITETSEIALYISPYRDSITAALDSVISYAPQTFDKSKGKMNTIIGNMLASATFSLSDRLFYNKERKQLDFCLLNHGGIRAVIPEGDVTIRTAFEIMPFENSIIVVALKGKQVYEMADYIAREGKAHPLHGITITLAKDKTVKKIFIQGKPVDDEKIYYVASIDYLVNGGDDMAFLSTNEGTYDLDYKLRELYIDYFKATDTLPVDSSQHVILE